MKIVAVCGIDTGIGKSMVTGLLGRALLEQGHSVMTQKLVQTGCPGCSEDILRHRQLMETSWNGEDAAGLSCPYCFPYPASPHLAARLAGTRIDPAALSAATAALTGYEYLLLEGAGGLMVPLNKDLLLIDYIAEHNYPLILVTSPRLGSINHTLLSLEAIRTRRLRLTGLLYNLYPEVDGVLVQDSSQVFLRALLRYNFPETLVTLDSLGIFSPNWPDLLP